LVGHNERCGCGPPSPARHGDVLAGHDGAECHAARAAVLAVWLDDTLHFAASAASRKARNLAARPACTLGVEGEGVDFVFEGTAAIVRDADTLHRVAAAYARTYEWHVEIRGGAFVADGAPTAGAPPFDVYAISLKQVFGFGHSESFSPTRWRF
jgi:hypothetical protein